MRTWKQLFVVAGLLLAASSLSACYYDPYWGGGPDWHHGGDYDDHDHGDHGYGDHDYGDHGPGGPGHGWGPGGGY
ncbi:MAG TPA: hypothetical protein VEQ16_11000 [Acidocella sp.]|jgi:hypothetical protein|nr:hypothetical protein [Acidocella sp.]